MSKPYAAPSQRSDASPGAANDRELEGRVALVTGVTRRAGIGAAIARELARAGAKVFVAFFRKYDRTQTWGSEPSETDDLIQELGALSDVSGLEIDLSLPTAPRELIEQALTRFGRVDILVNNAAHWEAGGIDQVGAAQLDRHYAVNTRAAVLLCAEFARVTETLGLGRIVNITSGQGRGPMPGELAYVVTKAALDALTVTLAAELASRNVTVNAIDPGPTDTGWISAEQRSALIRDSAAGRIAVPEDTARIVRLLARDDAASVTGQIIRVQPARQPT
jgi:3-oxoacyl-[acyl-carrier protein] reductase